MLSMAESKPYDHKDLTRCGICLSTQQEPKSLPCLHSYCLECLTRWAKGKAKVSCPICTQEFKIPSDGVKAFPTNFFINTLKERQATALTLQSRDTVVPCSSCGEVDEKVEGHCSRCGGFICAFCNTSHSKLKTLVNHKVIPYEDLESGKVNIRDISQTKYCNVHVDQVLWFYCETCGVLTCRDCTVVDHPASSHKLVNLETATKGHKQEIDQLVQDCDGVNKATVDTLKEIAGVSDNLQKAGRKVDDAIDESVNKALEQVEQQRYKLKAEAKNIVSERMKQLEAQKEEVLLQQTRVQTAMQMATEVVKTGSDYDLAVIYTSLKTNLIELRDVKLEPVDKRKANISFKPAHINQESVGKLGYVEVNRCREAFGVWKLETSFGKDGVGKLKCGRGVAITQEGDLAVTDFHDHAIKIYRKTGKFKSSFKVPGDPWNIIARTDGNFFLTDLANTVRVYDVKGNLKREFPTKSPENISSNTQNTKHWGLAIDNNSNLLVGEGNQKYISKHRLDGTHIMSFNVPIKPYAISVSADDNILVSLPSEHAALFNASGVHLQTVESPTGSLWSPFGTCYTSKNEIFIANWCDPDAIYCYNAETSAYIGCLTKDVTQPAGLALMDDEETLVVVEQKGIKIFKLQ